MSRSCMSPRYVARLVLHGAWRHGLLAVLGLTLLATEAAASCPRRTREQVRRLVPSVLFWPAAPFILGAKRKSAPMPAVGAAARVSHRDANGDRHFTEGRFVRSDESGITLSHPDGTMVNIPIAAVLCLQTPRRAISAGVGNGFMVGAAAGVTTALVIGTFESDIDERRAIYSIGTMLLYAVGATGGTFVGAAVRGTTWDTALDRTR